jgi:splicing factor 3B subunit 2
MIETIRNGDSHDLTNNNVSNEQDGSLDQEIMDNKAQKHKNKTNENKKKKRRRKKKILQSSSITEAIPAKRLPEDVQIEYISANVLDENDPLYKEFSRVFNKFASAEELTRDKSEEQQAQQEQQQQQLTIADIASMETSLDSKEIDKLKPMSRKARKKAKQMEISELKKTAKRPDVVEMHDVTAQDPKLLVYLKSIKNTVPVPQHWSQKRKYLQGKRGIEKPPFQLPDFIRDTGIQQARDAQQQKEDQKKSKQKARERIRPKLGAIDIDYSILRDAFFKYQTKPKLTTIGDLYYEGKEFRVKKGVNEFKPGVLSERLKQALGMPPGAPPPWLINMQKYGPPPSYPKLRIPGLNAPIPEGASYGYNPGGWGKLPVDLTGKPIYNLYFDNETNPELQKEKEEDIYRATHVKHWGDIEYIEEEEEEEVQEEEERKAEEVLTASVEIPAASAAQAKTVLPSTGIPRPPSPPTTVLPSLEPPEEINIRKIAPPAPESPKALYQVLEEQKISALASGGIMGSTHTYVFPTRAHSEAAISINPDKLDNLEEELLKKQTSVLQESKQAFTISKEAQEEEESKKRKRKDKEKKKKKIKF